MRPLIRKPGARWFMAVMAIAAGVFGARSNGFLPLRTG